MSDQTTESIETEEQNATKATADENVRELRKEDGELVEDSDDEVVAPASKPERAIAASTSHPKDKIKKEAPEMNIQLQR